MPNGFVVPDWFDGQKFNFVICIAISLRSMRSYSNHSDVNTFHFVWACEMFQKYVEFLAIGRAQSVTRLSNVRHRNSYTIADVVFVFFQLCHGLAWTSVEHSPNSYTSSRKTLLPMNWTKRRRRCETSVAIWQKIRHMAKPATETRIYRLVKLAPFFYVKTVDHMCSNIDFNRWTMFTYVDGEDHYISSGSQRPRWATFCRWPNRKGWRNWWRPFALPVAVHINSSRTSKMYVFEGSADARAQTPCDHVHSTVVTALRSYINIVHYYSAGGEHEFGQVRWAGRTY